MRISDWSSDVCSSDLESGSERVIHTLRANDDLGCSAEACEFAEAFASHNVTQATLGTDVRLCAISAKATFTVDGQELFLDIVRRHAVPIVCDGNRDIIGQRRQKDGEWVALELLDLEIGRAHV